jgi:hypothetical protein
VRGQPERQQRTERPRAHAATCGQRRPSLPWCAVLWRISGRWLYDSPGIGSRNACGCSARPNAASRRAPRPRCGRAPAQPRALVAMQSISHRTRRPRRWPDLPRGSRSAPPERKEDQKGSAGAPGTRSAGGLTMGWVMIFWSLDAIVTNGLPALCSAPCLPSSSSRPKHSVRAHEGLRVLRAINTQSPTNVRFRVFEQTIQKYGRKGKGGKGKGRVRARAERRGRLCQRQRRGRGGPGRRGRVQVQAPPRADPRPRDQLEHRHCAGARSGSQRGRQGASPFLSSSEHCGRAYTPRLPLRLREHRPARELPAALAFYSTEPPAHVAAGAGGLSGAAGAGAGLARRRHLAA